MRTLKPLIALTALALAACANAEGGSFSTVVAPSAPAAPPPAAKPEPQPDPKKAICDWAVGAGVPAMRLDKADSAQTKREVAALQRAYTDACVSPAPAASK